jgi:hypothetical protein
LLALSTEQRLHLRKKDLFFKFLLFLVTIKPIINTFHDVSLIGGIKLLQFVSGMVFLGLLFSVLTKTSNKKLSRIQTVFGIFCFIYLVNIIRVLVYNFDLNTFKSFLKVAAFPLFYFYLKKNTFHKIDIELILNAFLRSVVSTIIVIIIDLFIFSSYQSNRGFDRYDTSYGDIATLGIQINIITILIFYNLLSPQIRKSKKNTLFFFLVMLILFVALIKISHASSFGVFTFTCILFILFKFKEAFIKHLFFVIITIVLGVVAIGSYLYSFVIKFYSREFLSLFSNESILSKTYLFHGRVGRWVMHLDWFQNETVFNKIFGGLSVKYFFLMSHGPHNDFLRILYLTGYFGLFVYLLFLLLIFLKTSKMNFEGSFLTISCLIFIVSYSITLTPTTYFDLCLFMLSVFSLAFLHNNEKKENSIFR